MVALAPVPGSAIRFQGRIVAKELEPGYYVTSFEEPWMYIVKKLPFIRSRLVV